MKYIKEPIGKKSKWSQPKAMIRFHELRCDGGLYATLKWVGMFRSLAVGECREDRFTFKRGGFLRPYVTVRREYLDTNLAVLSFESGSVIVNYMFGPGGVLEFASGKRYGFHRMGLWNSRWAFTDESGIPIVIFDRKIRAKPSGDVLVQRDPREIDNLNVLLMLGWYVLILDYEETEAAVGLGALAQPEHG